MQRFLRPQKSTCPDGLYSKPADTNNHFDVRRSARLRMGSGKLRLHGKKPPRLLSNFLNFSADSPPVLRRRRPTFREAKPNLSRPEPPSTQPTPPRPATNPSQPFLAKRKLKLPSSSIPLVPETPQATYRRRANMFLSPSPTPANAKKTLPALQKRRLSDLLPRGPPTQRNHVDDKKVKRTVSDLSSQVSSAFLSRDATAGTAEHSKRQLSDLSTPGPTHLTYNLNSEGASQTRLHANPSSSSLSSAHLSTKNPDESIPKRTPSDLPPCVSFLTESAEDLLAATALIPEVQPTREIRRALGRRNQPIPKQSAAAADMPFVSGQPLGDTGTVQETTVKHVTRVMERQSRPSSPTTSVPHTQTPSPSTPVSRIESHHLVNVIDNMRHPTLCEESGIPACTHVPDRPDSPDPTFLRVTDEKSARQPIYAIAAKLPSLRLKLGKRASRVSILSRSFESLPKHDSQLQEAKELDLPPDQTHVDLQNKLGDVKMKRPLVNEPTNEQVMTMLEKATTVEALVDLVRQHGESLSVTGGSLKKLAKIVSDTETKEGIWLCGGVDAIIMAMGRHADVGRVQVEGAKVLASAVSGHDYNKNALVNDFGLDALISGMRGFPRDVEVQIWSCQALNNVAANNSGYKEVVGKKGGVSAAIEALALHRVSAEVVEGSANLLHTLVFGVPCNVERLANNSEWAGVLLDVLAENSDCMAIEIQSKLLEVIVEGARVHLMSVGDGALTAALSAMSRNVHEKEVFCTGTTAARTLVKDGMNGMDKALSAAGAVASLMDMLQCSVATVSRLKAT